MKPLRFGPIGRERPGIMDRNGTVRDLSGVVKDIDGTRTMIFKPAFLVAYISQFMSLQPGDIVTTGTPPGVGMGQKPPVYLNVGDTVDLGIAHLGAQRQVVV